MADTVKHDIKIYDLRNNLTFSSVVKCTCGWTAYAKDIGQAEGHRKYHETQAIAMRSKSELHNG